MGSVKLYKQKFFQILYGGFLSYMAFPASASECKDFIDLIETKLFEEPNNSSLIEQLETAQQNCQLTKEKSPSSFSYFFGLKFGHDSNANQRTSIDGLDLTFGDQTVTVELDEKPKSSNYITLSLEYQDFLSASTLGKYWLKATHLNDSELDDEYDWGAALKQQVSNDDIVELTASSQKKLGLSTYWLRSDWLHYFTPSAYIDAHVGIRRHEKNSYLNSNHLGLSFFKKGSDHGYWFGVNNETDFSKELPGGGNYSFHTGVSYQGVSLVGRISRDKKGYNPLLDNNAVRNLNTVSLGYEHEFLRQKASSQKLSARWVKQESNLSLFSWTGFNIHWEYQYRF